MKKITIIIIAVAIAVVATLGIVFSFQRNKFIEKNPTELSEEEILALYSKVNPSTDATVLSQLYKDKTMGNGYILATALKAATPRDMETDLPLDAVLPTIKQEKVEEKIKEIFGPLNYQHATTYILSDGICGFKYKEDLNVYELIPGCGGNSNESFARRIKETKQIDNKILIYEQSVYLYNDWDTEMSRKYIYNNCNQQKLLDYIETDSQNTAPFKLESYIDEGSIYEYTLEKYEDRYIFKGISLLD